MRVAIIGNAAGGKSTLARELARNQGLPHIDVDRILWRDGWVLTPVELYEEQHANIIAGDNWLIDGLGRDASIAERIARATHVILIDLPLWVHYWFAAERQITWATGTLEHPPGGSAQMPQTQALFRTMWEVDQQWMPTLRRLCDQAWDAGKVVVRLASVDDLDAFAKSI